MGRGPGKEEALRLKQTWRHNGGSGEWGLRAAARRAWGQARVAETIVNV